MLGSFYQNAVFEAYMFAGDGGHTLAGNHDSCQIERIGSGDRIDLTAGLQTFYGSQRFHCNRESKLFADEPADEPAPADFATIFEPAECNQQVTPAWQDAFPRQQLAEDHAIALEQHAAHRFEGTVRIFSLQWREQ